MATLLQRVRTARGQCSNCGGNVYDCRSYGCNESDAVYRATTPARSPIVQSPATRRALASQLPPKVLR